MTNQSIIGKSVRIVSNPAIPEIIQAFNVLNIPNFDTFQAKNLISFFHSHKIELVINRNRENPLYIFFLNKKEFKPVLPNELEIILISQLERLGCPTNIVYSVYKAEFLPLLNNFILHAEQSE